MICIVCGSRAYSQWCVRHKPRKPIATYKHPKQRSTKEVVYQSWKESECRPALIARDGNVCSCCHRHATDGEKLDIEHTLTKGSRPDLKHDLDNLTLMCRVPCHYNKTNGLPCPHL